jgi:hypothetical protein
MGAPGIAATLSSARELRINVKDVRRDWLQPGDLARYLESGVQPGSEHVRKASESGLLFIVTSVLKSASLATVIDREVAETIRATAPTPGLPVAIKVEQSRNNADASIVTFTGPMPLTFAFQAVRLVYEDGAYSDFASAHGLSGYAWGTDAGPAEGTLLLHDDLNEIMR